MSRHVIFVPFMTAFGGVERLVLGLSRFLNARGCPHSIVTFSNELDLESDADWPIGVCELQARGHPLLEGYILRRWLHAGNRTQYLNTPILAFDQIGAFYAAVVSSAY